MKAGALEFADKPGQEEERCTLDGKHYHERWPEKIICCWHFDALDKMIRLLDGIGQANREARLVLKNSEPLKRLGT
jgi:hypothetical protein